MSDIEFIVVGAGHAGIEAAYGAARMGVKTLLVTMNLDNIGKMSCNPAIGGVSKGNLVVELDALGGLMPRGADACGIQFRILNRSRGMAVWGLRAQVDRDAYVGWMSGALFNTPDLIVRQGMVEKVCVGKGGVEGVEIAGEGLVRCKAVVVTAGTFLRGLVHIGLKSYPAGRTNEPPSDTLSESLASLGLKIGRMKTGTPPRVLKKSLDLDLLERQDGEENVPPFSLRTRRRRKKQEPCYITHTNEAVHEIIRRNIDRSAMYSGRIQGIGPRYCPSIEDKVMKFPHHERHQVFIEPEGIRSEEVYLNGISTNMPVEIQEQMVHRVPGLRNAVIVRPGYAIEYDFVLPTQLDHTLRVREVNGLYLAGQINGTSGYEEAALQGYVAGVNVARWIHGEAPFTLGRDEAYAGVMIDDLVLRGVDEPYRMMTARAECRLQLGYQTAYHRLINYGREHGLISGVLHRRVTRREEKIQKTVEELSQQKITPNRKTREKLSRTFNFALTRETTLANLYRRTRGDLLQLMRVFHPDVTEDREFWERVAFEIVYRHYVERQEKLLLETRKWESIQIKGGIQFRDIPGISREMAERLERVRPRTLAQAMRIPGITPSAVTQLYVYLRSRQDLRQKTGR